MRKIIIFIIFLSFHLMGFSQNQKWEVSIGVSNRQDYAEDIIECYDRGYYIAGGYEGEYGWNIKTDINGLIKYDKILKYSSSSIGVSSLVQDLEGNIYICGYLVLDNAWPFVAKFDSCGEKLWCTAFVSNIYDFGGVAQKILINKNGEIIVLVFMSSYDQIDQIFLFGFSPNGDLLWTNPYASKNNYPEIGVAVGKDLKKINGMYIISGYCYWPYPDNPSHKFLRPFFIGIDSLFNEKWILPFAVMDSIYGEAYSVIDINDSVFMGIGNRWLESYNNNSLLMFFNKNGDELGFKQIPNEVIGPNVDYNEIQDIERINNSLFITTCYLGIETELYFGEFVLDTTGTIHNVAIRDLCSGRSSLIKTFDNNFVIETAIAEGNGDDDILLYKIDENLESVPFDTNQYTYDSLCLHQIQSGTIDLSDCLIVTDIGETPTPEEYYAKLKTIPIKAFPNPAKENITLAFENTKYHQNMQLECFDIFGRKVHKEKIYTAQLETEINISQWNEGLYVAVVMSDGKVLGKVKFVVLR